MGLWLKSFGVRVLRVMLQVPPVLNKHASAYETEGHNTSVFIGYADSYFSCKKIPMPLQISGVDSLRCCP